MASRALAVLACAALLASLATADLYMHYPPGSNDRNRERNDNRDNGARAREARFPDRRPRRRPPLRLAEQRQGWIPVARRCRHARLPRPSQLLHGLGAAHRVD